MHLDLYILFVKEIYKTVLNMHFTKSAKNYLSIDDDLPFLRKEYCVEK